MIIRRIQAPQLFPIIAAAYLLVFIYSFNSFAIVLNLGGVKFQTLEVRIYDYFWVRFDYNAAAALTMIQLFINILIIPELVVNLRMEMEKGKDLL